SARFASMWPLMPAAIFTQSSWVATTMVTSLSKKSENRLASASDTSSRLTGLSLSVLSVLSLLSVLSVLSGAGAAVLSAFLSAAGLGGSANAGVLDATVTASIAAVVPARRAAASVVRLRIGVMDTLLRGSADHATGRAERASEITAACQA